MDEALPRAYTPELYQQKCSAVFEHVYETYPERDAGVYGMASVIGPAVGGILTDGPGWRW